MPVEQKVENISSVIDDAKEFTALPTPVYAGRCKGCGGSACQGSCQGSCRGCRGSELIVLKSNDRLGNTKDNEKSSKAA